jgi:hypothetical protein
MFNDPDVPGRPGTFFSLSRRRERERRSCGEANGRFVEGTQEICSNSLMIENMMEIDGT